MRVYNQDEFGLHEDLVLKSITQGAVYVHPTDTIYGIGCDATNSDAVRRVRNAKNQHDQPFSIIAPSKHWIRDHCILSQEAEDWLEKLPGPYTLIMKLKKKGSIAPEVIPGKDTIGVRMPDHWIQDVALALNRPLVTTSANVHGKTFMTTLENLAPELQHKIDFALYEGSKHGKPSTIVDLTGAVRIISREAPKPRIIEHILAKGASAARRIAARLKATVQRQ